jgi:putative acetyltransferase
VIVRPERPTDYDAIDVVVAAAFGKRAEAELVRRIRASDRYVAELAFVAEVEDELAGHTMLSYVDIDGVERRVLQLAPMAVRPDRQRQGVVSELARAALAAADRRGEPLVLVLGIPAYYPRFGFRRGSELGLEPPDPAIPDEAWMAIPLRAYDPAIRGRVVFPDAFNAV